MILKVQVTAINVSMAVTQTSPSPCAMWPSPAENFAPSARTGNWIASP